MLDREGYRACIGVVLVNAEGRAFWAKRIKGDSWQFPQGGIKPGESPRTAMFRELREETGLRAGQVKLLGRTKDWLRYDVPRDWVSRDSNGLFRGQKMIWFLLLLKAPDTEVKLDSGFKPEFSDWRWVDYWIAPAEGIEFKREVYAAALKELFPLLPKKPFRLRLGARGDKR